MFVIILTLLKWETGLLINADSLRPQENSENMPIADPALFIVARDDLPLRRFWDPCAVAKFALDNQSLISIQAGQFKLDVSGSFS